MTDREIGESALRTFAQVYNQMWPSRTPLDAQALIAYYDNSNSYFIDTFGFSISESGFDEGNVRNAMQELAAKTPDDAYPFWNSYYNALQGQVDSLIFNQIPNILKDTASDTVKTVAPILGLGAGIYVLIIAAPLVINFLFKPSSSKASS